MTDIEWSDESWNPIRARLRSDPAVIGWHCEHASPGCEHCYSETRNRSGRCNMGTKLPYKPGHRKDIEVFLDEAALVKPLRWKKGRKVFVCSMTDLFADFVPDAMIDRIFAVMALCPQHTFQVLTKRSARMREYCQSRFETEHGSEALCEAIEELDQFNSDAGGEHDAPLPNVWLGVSIEDQQRADERIPDLLATPAALRWISAEPLLGPVDLERVYDTPNTYFKATSAKLGLSYNGQRLDWVVVGGESGSKARPMHPDWARALRDQCAAAGVPFFFKQWGAWWPNPPEATMTIQQFNRQLRYIDVDTGREKGHPTRTSDASMRKVGKKRAGRLLDGVEHNGIPGDV